MNGSDAPVFDSKLFLNNLDDGGQAVGRARCVGDDLLVGVIGKKRLVIASQDNVHRTFLLDGRGHDHLLDSLVKKGLQRGNLEELSRALHDHFNVRVKLQGLQSFVLREFDRFPVNDNGIVVDAVNVLVPRAMHTVVLDQISGTLGAAQIVDVHHVQCGIIPRVAQDETPNATIAVQQAFGGHADCVQIADTVDDRGM